MRVKRLKLWWQLYVTSMPARDVWNIRPLDFCWTEYIQKHCKMKKCSTISMCLIYHNWNNTVSYKVIIVGISYPLQQFILHSCCKKKKWQVADEWRIKRTEDLRRHNSFLSRSFKFSLTLSWPGCSYTTDSFQFLMNLNTFVYIFRQTLVQIYKHIVHTPYVRVAFLKPSIP